MRRITTHIIIFVVALLAYSGAVAQQLQEELRSFSQQLLKAETVEMNITVTSFMLDGEKEVMTASLYRKGDTFYSSLGEIETMVTERYVFSVNHVNKTITIGTNPGEEKSAFEDFQHTDMMVADGATIHYNGVVEGKKVYEITSKEGMMTNTAIYLDEKSNMLRKVVYHYRDASAGASKSIIDYGQIKLNQAITPTILSESRFAIKKGSNWQPAEAFAGYQIINTTR